jgi:hypothetical protein
MKGRFRHAHPSLFKVGWIDIRLMFEKRVSIPAIEIPPALSGEG